MAEYLTQINVTDFDAHMYAPLLGSLGVSAAMVFSGYFLNLKFLIFFLAVGAAYATALSAEGIAATWTRYPKFGMRALVPVVMAGIISIYGLVVGVVVGERLKASYEGYTIHQ